MRKHDWTGVRVVTLHDKESKREGAKARGQQAWEVDLSKAGGGAVGKRWKIWIGALASKLTLTTSELLRALDRLPNGKGKRPGNDFSYGSEDDREAIVEVTRRHLWSRRRLLWVPTPTSKRFGGLGSRASRIYYRSARPLELSDPVDEWKGLRDATGFYEESKPGKGRDGWTLQLNHASRVVWGWMQHHRQQFIHTNELELRSYEFAVWKTTSSGGEVRYEGHRWPLGEPDDSEQELTLVVPAKGREVKLAGKGLSGAGTYARVKRRPRLSSGAIEAIPARTRPLVRATEGAPLTAVERKALQEFLTEARQRVKSYWGGRQRLGQVKDFEHNARIILAGFFRTNHDTVEEGNNPQAPLVRWLIMADLQQGYVSDGVTRSYRGWVEGMIAAANAAKLAVPVLELIFGKQVRGGKVHYRFEWWMEMVGPDLSLDKGVDVGGALRVGTYHVRSWKVEAKADGTSKETPRWGGKSVGLTLVFVKGLLGWGVSPLPVTVNLAGATAKSEFTTPYPYEPADLSGDFAIIGVERAAGLAVAEVKSKAVMTLYCSPPYENLVVDASGPAIELGLNAGAGGTGSIQLGYLFRPGDKRVTKELARSLVREQAVGKLKTRQRAHFDFDAPALSEGGRSALAEVCAEYLLAFRSAGTRLEIVGHTSRKGAADYNQGLSQLRARNTRQAIEDLVGDSFAVSIGPSKSFRNRVRPPNYFEGAVRGRGEQEAADQGDPDGKKSSARRRVDIDLDHEMRYTLTPKG